MRKAGFIAGVILVAAMTIQHARAVDWIGGVGPWVNGANWNTGTPPGSTDTANINNNGTAQLAGLDVGEALVLALGGSAGTSGNLAMTGGTLVPNKFQIGEAGTGTATVTAGNLVVGGNSLFVGGENGTGTGTLTINGTTALVESGDDIQLGRVGTGTLEMSAGRMEGVFTVVGKFGTGTWNQSGGLFVATQDMEIGDGGRPDQTNIAGPRTGTINLSGGVIQADDFAIGNRSGTGTVNISGTGYLAVTETGGGQMWIGRGLDWTGNPGAGGATTLRVTGGDAIVVANEGFFMNIDQVASSSTLIAEITGPTHTTIKVGGNAILTEGTFRVELNGYVPSSGDSWVILQSGADIEAELATIDAYITSNGYNPVIHDLPTLFPGTLMGTTFAVEDLSATLPPGLSWQVNYTSTDVILSVTGTVACDFDGNGMCDIADIDALVMEISSGGMTAIYDLNGDGDVDVDDLPIWLSVAGEQNLGPGRAYLGGDANLSGDVDGSDFGIWNSNKFTVTGKWSMGDFNADGATDGSDFGIWNGNKFTSSNEGATVPEPGLWVGILVILIFAIRRVDSPKSYTGDEHRDRLQAFLSFCCSRYRH